MSIPDPSPQKSNSLPWGALKVVLAVVILAAGGIALWLYWQHEGTYPSTEDAYVQANIVTIAAEITGSTKSVDVIENQRVSKGDVLFRLDDTLLQNALTQAKAQVDTVSEAAGSLSKQVESAKALVTSATSAKQTADDELARSTDLLKRGDVTQTTAEADKSAAAQAAAALDSAKSQLAAAQSAVLANAQSTIEAAAQLASAQTNLSYAVVTAPVDGWIANISLRPGSVVAAYQPLFSLIDATEWWVDANFKETDLTRIAKGMPATIVVDMLPGTQLKGHVSSLGMGSGATFALLPAQNASGNWVKVTQRFPVRIALEAADAGLRVGASATVTVDTTGGAATP